MSSRVSDDFISICATKRVPRCQADALRSRPKPTRKGRGDIQLFEPLDDELRLFVQHHLAEPFAHRFRFLLSAFAAEKRLLPSLTQRRLFKSEFRGASHHGGIHYMVPLPGHVVERDDFAADFLVDRPKMLVDDFASFVCHSWLEFHVAHGVPRHVLNLVPRLRALAESGDRTESEK